MVDPFPSLLLKLLRMLKPSLTALSLGHRLQLPPPAMVLLAPVAMALVGSLNPPSQRLLMRAVAVAVVAAVALSYHQADLPAEGGKCHQLPRAQQGVHQMQY